MKRKLEQELSSVADQFTGLAQKLKDTSSDVATRGRLLLSDLEGRSVWGAMIGSPSWNLWRALIEFEEIVTATASGQHRHKIYFE
jgi:hypothetical protein